MQCLRSARAAATLIEVIVVLAILAILIGLTLSAVQQARAAAARTQCANNLRQIALGLSNYHAAQSQLPSGMQNNVDSAQPYLSWLARILPYVEQDAVWRQTLDAYQADNNFTNDPPHPFATVIRLYGCPADARVQTVGLARGKLHAAFTSYLGVGGTRTFKGDGTLFTNSTVRLTDITDGTSTTLLVGERPPSRDLWYGWWYAGHGVSGTGMGDMVLGVREMSPPADAYVPNCGGPAHFGPGRIDNMCDTFHFWSLHSGGANFAFADGSVSFLAYSADPLLPALATRAGGEVAELP
jgi:prepilin-type processing-associated H-X9-DG protein